MIREGAKVVYTGVQADGLSVGDEGRVVLSDGGVCHVLWSTGAKEHQISALYEDSLVLEGSHSGDGLDDSLDLGSLVTFSARHSYDAGGSIQVVSEMAEQGHLTSFGDIAEEALSLIAARVRQDPSVRVATASLEEDEVEEVVRLASACLIRDAFGDGDGDG